MISFRSCLWFDDNALQAVEFYKTVFSNVEMGHIERYGKAGFEHHGRAEGTVMTVPFKIGQQKFLALNGGPYFKPNPSLSNFVFCNSKTELQNMWNLLAKDGLTRMELTEYPWAPLYGWIKDRFDTEWQLMYSENQNEVLPAFLFVDSLYGKGSSAIDFYTQHFSPSNVIIKAMDPSNKYVLHSQFTLGDQKFVLSEGAGSHGFVFNEGYSIMIDCETQAEIDYHWNGLIDHGGKKSKCGWLKDQFGVSWQVGPGMLDEWMRTSTPEQKDKFMLALLEMEKLDIELLRAALRSS
jgi:predicted 3-demethylubiquinone-9 3-methyltransferase (glyoxalase superfamily)